MCSGSQTGQGPGKFSTLLPRPGRRRRRLGTAAGAIAILVLWTALPGAPGVLAEPPNLSALKAQLRAYHASGTYGHELAAVAATGRDHLRERAGAVQRPALVLDIDETALSNFSQILANDFGYIRGGSCVVEESSELSSPCGWKDWVGLGKATALSPILDLAQTAADRGVTLFFITGRRESLRAATEENLRSAGYPAWERLYMKPDDADLPSAVPYKSAKRAEIEAEGYTIILNVGDQYSDLGGGHSERALKLPNPFYMVP